MFTSRPSELLSLSGLVAEPSTMTMVMVWPSFGHNRRIHTGNACRTDLVLVLLALDEATGRNDGDESGWPVSTMICTAVSFCWIDVPTVESATIATVQK